MLPYSGYVCMGVYMLYPLVCIYGCVVHKRNFIPNDELASSLFKRVPQILNRLDEELGSMVASLWKSVMVSTSKLI
jgi:hypothetical protein